MQLFGLFFGPLKKSLSFHKSRPTGFGPVRSKNSARAFGLWTGPDPSLLLSSQFSFLVATFFVENCANKLRVSGYAKSDQIEASVQNPTTAKFAKIIHFTEACAVSQKTPYFQFVG